MFRIGGVRSMHEKIYKRMTMLRKGGANGVFRRIFLGTGEKSGVISRILLYAMLVILSYIFLYPFLYMLANSLKPLKDLINDAVKWLPTELYFENYKQAFEVLKFKDTLLDTLLLTLIPALCQIAVAAMTGYAFARYRFRGRMIFMTILLITFILPKQITSMPTYLLFRDLDIIGTINAFLLPAITGQGVNNAIIVLIFYQFYSQIPTSLIEAAQLDGCGHIRVFLRVALPMAMSAFIIGFVFSFVWYWNDTYSASLFISGTGISTKSGLSTLLIELQRFEDSYKSLYPEGATTVNRINESIRMAGTIICILPLLAVYFLLQRFLVQSVDMIGIKE